MSEKGLFAHDKLKGKAYAKPNRVGNDGFVHLTPRRKFNPETSGKIMYMCHLEQSMDRYIPRDDLRRTELWVTDWRYQVHRECFAHIKLDDVRTMNPKGFVFASSKTIHDFVLVAIRENVVLKQNDIIVGEAGFIYKNITKLTQMNQIINTVLKHEYERYSKDEANINWRFGTRRSFNKIYQNISIYALKRNGTFFYWSGWVGQLGEAFDGRYFLPNNLKTQHLEQRHLWATRTYNDKPITFKFGQHNGMEKWY